ncbi:glycosyltransferase family 4 protein [Castellaniella sp.]|uniref:glycosyltransferase family 4 protein n=1 Tax=Castellaniella sp. TaxID=1955812 RepID=UPI003567872E
MYEIWFWQRIISPHMAGLAASLARNGRKVIYIVEQSMSKDRRELGWQVPKFDGIDLRYVTTAVEVKKEVESAPLDSIHICQGLRANGLIGQAQRLLDSRGLQQWAIMETIDETGLRGCVKRGVYRALLYYWRSRLSGILAIGVRMPRWFEERGFPYDKIFPFAYFLPEPIALEIPSRTNHRYRILFVGQLIERKRLDLLICALGELLRRGFVNFSLQVVGSGVLAQSLQAHAAKVLGERLEWTGQLPMSDIQKLMARADVLVLPSRHDGWGAVVSEAMMVGTPAIVSRSCGCAGVVEASGFGSVFKTGKALELAGLLEQHVTQGCIQQHDRHVLRSWSVCLGADVGADYLESILMYRNGGAARPEPPWCNNQAAFNRRN